MKLSDLVFVYSTRDYNWPHVGRTLAWSSPVFLETLRRCDKVIQTRLGWSIESDILPNQHFQISEEYCEPGLITMQISLTELWRSLGVRPAVVVGVCAGEIGAAYAAGVLRLEDAVDLACRMSELFRRDVGRGRMLMVDLPDPALLKQSSLYYVSACIGGKTLIGCSEENFEELRLFLRQSGFVFRQILSKYALHTPEADSWGADFCRVPVGYKPPRIPFYSALLGRLDTGMCLDAHHWWKVAKEPVVHFDDVFRSMFQAGYRTFLEVNSHLIFAKTIEELGLQNNATVKVLPARPPIQFPAEFIQQSLTELKGLGCLKADAV